MILEIKASDVHRIVQQAQQGDWIPISIVMALIGVILYLIIRQNDAKHSATSEMMKKLTESQLIVEKMLAVHESEIGHLKERA